MAPDVTFYCPSSMREKPPLIPRYEGTQEMGENTLENKVLEQKRMGIWLYVPELSRWFDISAGDTKLKIDERDVPAVYSYSFSLEDVASAGVYVVHTKHNEQNKYAIANGLGEMEKKRMTHIAAIDSSIPGRTDFLFYVDLMEKNPETIMYFSVVSPYGVLYVNVLDGSEKLAERYCTALNDQTFAQIIVQSADAGEPKKITVDRGINFLNKSLEDLAVFVYRPHADIIVEPPSKLFPPAFGKN